MDRKTGRIWLMLDANRAIIREDGNPMNYYANAADIKDFKSEEWASYDFSRATFEVDGDRATAVDAERTWKKS